MPAVTTSTSVATAANARVWARGNCQGGLNGLVTPSSSFAANWLAVANLSAGTLAIARVIARSTDSGTPSRTRRTEGTGSTSRLAVMDCGVGPM